MSVLDVFERLDRERKEKETAHGPVEWLIAGLGNPGPKYAGTRHNAGFITLDLYAKEKGLRIDRLKFQGLTGQAQIAGKNVLFLKPQTFMNLSGESVRDAAQFYKLPPERVIVIFDDISLPVGKLRVRAKGSAGGQNGVKNIIYQLGSDAFPRVKVGIGGKPHPDFDLADWVLSSFAKEEQEIIEKTAARAMLAAEEIIKNGPAAAAQAYNGG